MWRVPLPLFSESDQEAYECHAYGDGRPPEADLDTGLPSQRPDLHEQHFVTRNGKRTYDELESDAQLAEESGLAALCSRPVPQTTLPTGLTVKWVNAPDENDVSFTDRPDIQHVQFSPPFAFRPSSRGRASGDQPKSILKHSVQAYEQHIPDCRPQPPCFEFDLSPYIARTEAILSRFPPQPPIPKPKFSLLRDSQLLSLPSQHIQPGPIDRPSTSSSFQNISSPKSSSINRRDHQDQHDFISRSQTVASQQHLTSELTRAHLHNSPPRQHLTSSPTHARSHHSPPPKHLTSTVLQAHSHDTPLRRQVLQKHFISTLEQSQAPHRQIITPTRRLAERPSAVDIYPALQADFIPPPTAIPEPARRIGGIFWAATSYFLQFLVNTYFGTAWNYLFPREDARTREIIAVQTEARSPKRRAIEAADMPKNTASPQRGKVASMPGHFPDSEDMSLTARDTHHAKQTHSSLETPPDSRPATSESAIAGTSGTCVLLPTPSGRTTGFGRAPKPEQVQLEAPKQLGVVETPRQAQEQTQLNQNDAMGKSAAAAESDESNKIADSEPMPGTERFTEAEQSAEYKHIAETFPVEKHGISRMLEPTDDWIHTPLDPAFHVKTIEEYRAAQEERWRMIREGSKGLDPEEAERRLRASHSRKPRQTPRFGPGVETNDERNERINSLVERTNRLTMAKRRSKSKEEAERIRQERKAARVPVKRKEGLVEQVCRRAAERDIELQTVELKKQVQREAKAAADEEKALEAERMRREAEEEQSKAEVQAAPPEDEIVRLLSPEWEDRVATALASTSSEKVLATSTEGVEIRRYSFDKLLPQQSNKASSPKAQPLGWLDDEVVHAIVCFIVARWKELSGYVKGPDNVPEVESYNPGWYTNYKQSGVQKIKTWSRRKGIQGPKLLRVRKMLLPINTGAHWMLLVISPRDRSIELLDSMNGRSDKYFAVAREWLQMELGEAYLAEEWSEFDGHSAQQLNMDDCGVFTCINAICAAENRPYSDVQSTRDMLDARKMLAALLLNGGFKGDFAL